MWLVDMSGFRIDSKLDNYLYEGGLALEYRIPYLNLLMSENRLSLFLPLWLSDPPPGEANFKWRWMISLTL